jgi:hypothetical protein
MGVASTGCVVERHSSYVSPLDYGSSIPTCPAIVDPAESVMIDTDVGAKLTLGSGEGVSVEYSSGGIWHLQTTCSAGYQCAFDVTAEVFEGTVSNVVGEDLESDDAVGSSCPDSAYLLAKTAGDFDGMVFTAKPGAKVRVTAALDDTIYANLIYWAEDGKVHNDATTNPIDFTPVKP